MSDVRTDPDGIALGALARLTAGLLAQRGGSLDYDTAKRAFREVATRDPLDTLLVTVLGGSYLFYLAEKDDNPKVTSFWDALVFITTCLSVGYADVFARTNAGKAIAAFVMTVGPAVSGRVLDPPAADEAPAPPAAAPPESLEAQRAIVERLDAILLALREREAVPAAAAT